MPWPRRPRSSPGTVVAAAVVTDLPPLVKWSTAIIAGGGIAGLTQSTTALLRAKSTLFTGGLGNPVVATGELGGALVLSLLALAAPFAALALVIVLLWLAFRWLRQIARREPPPAPIVTTPVDLLADDGDRLLIDAGGVPALNGGEVGLARLIAGAPDPAMTFQEIRGRGERIGLAVEIDAASAVAIGAIEQDVLGQKLRLPHLAMHGAARVGAENAAIDQRERRIKLIGEIFGPAAVISERGDRRQRVLIAGDGAKSGFHPPDGDQRPGRHAVALLDRGEQRGIRRLHLPAPGDNGGGATLGHELIERQFEALLAAVGPDGAGRIGRGHQGGDGPLPDPLGLGLLGEDPLPVLEPCAGIAAWGGFRRSGGDDQRRGEHYASVHLVAPHRGLRLTCPERGAW